MAIRKPVSGFQSAPTQFKLKRRYDSSLPVVGLILSIIGLVMVLSASQFFAAEKYGNAYYFFNRQLFFWLIGVAGFFYFLRVSLTDLYERRSLMLGIMIGLLVLVFVPFIGAEIANVHRWIGWGIVRFQPAELAELLLVIYLAGWLAAKGEAITGLVRFGMDRDSKIDRAISGLALTLA